MINSIELAVIFGIYSPREMKNFVSFISIGGIGMLKFCKKTSFLIVIGLVTFIHRKLGCSIFYPSTFLKVRDSNFIVILIIKFKKISFFNV